MQTRPPDETSGDHYDNGHAKPRNQLSIPSPEPAHLPAHSPAADLEATELLEAPRPFPTAKPSGAEAAKAQARVCSPSPQAWSPAPSLGRVQRFWSREVRLSVPHVDCRDHLANERTFLGYVRTSAALSMTGCIVAQLWHLQHAPRPDPVFGYHALGKPLSTILQASALATIVLGSVRFFRQQSAMARGRVHAGGWEVYAIMALSSVLLVALFAIQVGIEIWKERKGEM